MQKSAEAFRTISEVADWLGLQAHVLRFWESKFSQVKPVKRAGGRRYYRPADMLLLGGIRKLLHEDGMTIKGVQKILREEGIQHVARMSQPLDDLTAAELREERAGLAHMPELDSVSSDDDTENDVGIDTQVTVLETAAADEASTPVTHDEDAGTAPDLEDFGAPPQNADPAPPLEDQPSFPLDDPSPEPVASESAVAAEPDEHIEAADSETQQEPAPASEPETAPIAAEPPAAPKPLMVEISDGPTEAEIDAHPALLTLSVKCDGLSPEQAEAMRPILARLKVHHDNLAALSGATA